MATAPTLILYTVTGKSRPGEHCWDDPSVPPYFYDDRDMAKQAMLDLHADLLAGRDPRDSPLCLESDIGITKPLIRKKSATPKCPKFTGC